MIVYPTVAQNSPAWKLLRQGRATASRFNEIITAAKGEFSKSAKPYMCELLAACCETDVEEGEVPQFDTFWTRRGRALEPIARAGLAELIGHEIAQVGFCIHENSVIACSPDGLVKSGETYIAGAEIKCPSPAVHVQYVAAGGLPQDYVQQVHGSLVVTGLPRWHFYSYCPGMQPLHLVIEPDAYTEKVAAALERFTVEYKALREELIPRLQLTLPTSETQ